MIKKGIILGLPLLYVSLYALVDIEEEINAPVAEMKMLDDAMNRGIEEQRERNARRAMVIEDEQSFHTSAMLDFVDQGKEYVLEKSVEDTNNTEIKTKLEGRMLTITEIKKIEEVVIQDSVTLGTSSKSTQFYESTTSETLSLPTDADAQTLLSNYKNGIFKITIQKK